MMTDENTYQTGFPIEKMTIYLTNVVLTQEWVLNVGIYLGVKILFNSKIEDNRSIIWIWVWGYGIIKGEKTKQQSIESKDIFDKKILFLFSCLISFLSYP